MIAKAPVAGLAKTRLSPPCTVAQAAALALASLEDTLEAVLATPVARRVLALDGEPGPWVPPGIEVIPQASGGLDRRLAGAFAAVGGPALLIGMDTPQVDPGLLSSALEELETGDCDCVLGPACDGGWWTIGLRRADPAVFTGLPMSAPGTVAAQRRRLGELGLRHRELPRLRDVDTIADARAVAREWPQTRFARTLREIEAPASETGQPAPLAGAA